MTTYTVAHAFLGVSYACAISEDGDPPEIQRLKSEDAKEAFLMEQLAEGDTLLLENGGPNGKLALIASMRGVHVHLIPTFRVGNKEATRLAVDGQAWLVEDEPAIGNETSETLTSRKLRALALVANWITNRQLFTEQREADQTALLIQHDYRSYRMMQKILLANYLRLLSVYNDRYLLEAARTQGKEEGVKPIKRGMVSAAAAMKAIEALLVDIPEDERAAFGAKLGLDAISTKQAVPRKVVADMLKKIVNELLESSVFSPFMREMAATKKAIEKRLKSLDVYRQVLEPIPGCGPLIAARILAAIVDIRRFEGLANLKAYAGYHHFDDGSRARRRAGKVSNWNTELKQAVFLWTEQTLKMSSSPWRHRLDQRRGYELWKILEARQLQAMDQDLDIEILPAAFQARSVASVNDVTVEDLAILSAHVDVLRKQAGIKSVTSDEEEEDADAEPVAKDPKLAKLVRGVKMQALQKAKRWLGQQLLKHIFKSWRTCLGLSEFPEKPRKTGSEPTTWPATESTKAKTGSNGSNGKSIVPVKWCDI